MAKFVTFIESGAIRDAQMYTGENYGSADVDLSFDEDDSWADISANVFVGVVEANSRGEAINYAAREFGYDKKILDAEEV